MIRPAASARDCNTVRILAQVPSRCQRRNTAYAAAHSPQARLAGKLYRPPSTAFLPASQALPGGGRRAPLRRGAPGPRPAPRRGRAPRRVSTDYYARLERGKISGASREVLEAVARGLRLDDDERQHLFDLVTIIQRRPPRTKASNRTTVRPGIQRVLDSIDAPALVQNARLDRLAFNRIGRALHSLPADGSRDQYNYATWLFLDSRARRFHRDFDTATHDVVALLRAATAHDPYDRELIEIVGTLTTQSEQFSALWACHDVLRHRSGAKLLTHPNVGDLEFGYESFQLSTDPGLVMLVFTVEPNSPTAQAMQLLASWAASLSHGEDDAAEIEAEKQSRA